MQLSWHDREIKKWSLHSHLCREGYSPKFFSSLPVPFNQRQMPCAATTQSRSGNLPLPWLRMLFPKTIFSFVSAIAPKRGWEISPGWCSQQVLTSLWGFVLQWLTGHLAFSHRDAHMISFLKALQNPAGQSSLSLLPGNLWMAVGKMIARARPARDKWRHLKHGSRNWTTGFIKVTAGATGNSGGCAASGWKGSWNSSWMTPVNRCSWDPCRQFKGGKSLMAAYGHNLCAWNPIAKVTEAKLSSPAQCLPSSSPWGAQGKPSNS